MADHLRFSGLPSEQQRAAFAEIIGGSALLHQALEGLQSMALPDGWIVSGAIYNTVWNALTGRPPLTGIRDVDVFYFDAVDLSYEAEDRVIRQADKVFADMPIPAQVRNQARVHLWYEGHFGRPYPPLGSSCEGIDRFATRTHAIGIRLTTDRGLDL